MPLPINLKPNKKFELIRIGGKNDGGYLVEINSFKSSDYLISLGVSTDWSFEKEFIQNKNLKFKAYDGSIHEDFWQNWKKKSIRKLLRFSFKDFFKYLKIKKEFNLFFNNENLELSFIGNKDGQKKLKDIFSGLNYINIFLKIDIEGSEYDVLEDILTFEKIIIGLVIEFHSCIKNLNKIINFIDKTNLTLVHIHANNYDFVNKDGVPDTLELTFSKNPKIIGIKNTYPHPLDKPNKYNKPEIFLKFNES